MPDLSNSLGVISELEQPLLSGAALVVAFDRSAELAHDQGILQMQTLQQTCGQFAAGQHTDFERVARAAHLAAFEVLTYADICSSLSVRPDAECESLRQSGLNLQNRVLRHETLFYQNALSPSEVFYDDLFENEIMQTQHQAVSDRSSGSLEVTAPAMAAG